MSRSGGEGPWGAREFVVLLVDGGLVRCDAEGKRRCRPTTRTIDGHRHQSACHQDDVLRQVVIVFRGVRILCASRQWTKTLSRHIFIVGNSATSASRRHSICPGGRVFDSDNSVERQRHDELKDPGQQYMPAMPGQCWQTGTVQVFQDQLFRLDPCLIQGDKDI